MDSFIDGTLVCVVIATSTEYTTQKAATNKIAESKHVGSTIHVNPFLIDSFYD